MAVSRDTSDEAINVILDRAPSIVAILTVCLLVMSVSHEWGYFWIVGSQFQTFVSTIDYLSNGILWLPAGLLFIYGNVDWWRFKEQTENKKDWKKWKTWIWPSFVVIFYVGLFFISEWPPSSLLSFSLLTVLVFIWSKVWTSIFPFHALREPFGTIAQELLRSVPPVMLGMFVWGLINANADISSTADPYVVTFKANPQQHQLRLFLRTFEKGLLFKDPTTGRIEFIKWEDVSVISKPLSERSRSPLCYWFEVCPLKRKATAP